jgi:carbonic anhydrase/acetyltransferase-like protein (isoleucine patch superfamily)
MFYALAGLCTMDRAAGAAARRPAMQNIEGAYIAPGAVVTGDVVLAAGVNVWFGSVLRGDLARITLGPRVNIQDGCIVHTDRNAPQVIEEGVVVGHRAVLHGSRIGRETLIGIGAILLTGCEIGEECLIAAGALVTEGRRIPPRSVVMGVPGKVIRAITPEELKRTQNICAHYLELAQRYALAGTAGP